jgi:hypothetical protein
MAPFTEYPEPQKRAGDEAFSKYLVGLAIGRFNFSIGKCRSRTAGFCAMDERLGAEQA